MKNDIRCLIRCFMRPTTYQLQQLKGFGVINNVTLPQPIIRKRAYDSELSHLRCQPNRASSTKLSRAYL